MKINVVSLKLSINNLMILRDITLSIQPKEGVAFLGPNGVGKTTLCKGIMGLVRPFSGQIFVDDFEITGLSVRERFLKGFAYVPERAGIFNNLTIEENLKMGAIRREGKNKLEDNLELIYARFPWLKERRKMKAGNLSGGQRQILALMRAIMNEPEFLILDEPSQGVSAANIKVIYKTISSIVNEKRISFLITEQSPFYLKEIEALNKIYILSSGHISTILDASQTIKYESLWDLIALGG